MLQQRNVVVNLRAIANCSARNCTIRNARAGGNLIYFPDFRISTHFTLEHTYKIAPHV